MNSALKPVLASAGVPQPAGQSSPAKGNVASVNHASVAHPQGAQNSLNHASNSNNLAVQNLTQHVPAPQVPPHAVPSMAPVSANMAQMAQNMSNHGNLSHVNQNSAPPAPVVVPSPSKAATSSPLSLVAEKVNASQPLALTRLPEKLEKKEPEGNGQANGTLDSPKSASNTPVTLKAQNVEAIKDKIDIAKTSPSTTKPPEKTATLPSTSQKPESATPAVPADVSTQAKVVTASEPSEKSPSKPAEPKPTPTASVVSAQSESKPVSGSAISEPSPPEKEIAPTPTKVDPPVEIAKTEPVKAEEKKEEAPEKPPSTEEKPKELEVKEKQEPPKKEDIVDAPVKVVENKVEPRKIEPKKEIKPKSTLKLATVTPPLRKRRQVSPAKGTDGPSLAKKAADGESTPDARTKRNRTKVQLYQSPTPELAMATKLSASAGRSTPTKPNDDKLIVFYKNEYLAVRNAEGGFYVCQAMQNVYRTTRKIKIRWLSQDKAADPSGETYKPDFYDVTDMECVLTTLSLTRAAGGGGSQLLKPAERARASSILQRALRAETSPGALQLTPEHPDGLDLSLYTDESQLEKRARKRAGSKTSPRNKGDAAEAVKEETTPIKKARTTPKRSPKSTRKAKPTPPPAKTNNNKRKSTGSTPVVASTSKTATAVVEKAKATPRAAAKRTPAPKPEPVVTPLRKGRRAAAKEVPSPIVAQPSTSTGKTTRTPRKPPARK